MDADLKAIILDCTRGSDESRLNFPDVVRKLAEAGVEQYHADLRRSEKTYYMPDGQSEVVPCEPVRASIAQDFSARSVEAAIRSVQAGKLSYAQFCDSIAEAGCVGYTVSLAGRQAVYFARTGQSLAEPFPSARS